MKDAIIKLFNGEEKRRAKEIKSIVSDFVFNLPPNCLKAVLFALRQVLFLRSVIGRPPSVIRSREFQGKIK